MATWTGVGSGGAEVRVDARAVWEAEPVGWMDRMRTSEGAAGWLPGFQLEQVMGGFTYDNGTTRWGGGLRGLWGLLP